MTFARWTLLCLLSASSFRLAAQGSMQDLRLNQIQVKGTHNSYHQQPGIVFDASHRYTHLSLTDQLEKRGIRAFELDVHRPSSGSDLVVYHVASIDSKSSCAKFKDCLTLLKNWSNLHPAHVPITVWVEVKDANGGPKFVNFDRIDVEIREILGDRLITPDSLQKDHATLQDAIRADGWPRLADARGKFLFILDDHELTSTVYLTNNSLKGRVMFVRAAAATLHSPWAVVTKTGPGSFHSEALQNNFLISDNVCAADNAAADCHSELANAKAAGTHLLMDDFEGGESKQIHDGYFVDLDGAPVVACHPRNAPALCTTAQINQL